jgi:hypothetical protein
VVVSTYIWHPTLVTPTWCVALSRGTDASPVWSLVLCKGLVPVQTWWYPLLLWHNGGPTPRSHSRTSSARYWYRPRLICSWAYGNHTAGRSAQNGGIRTATLNISASIALFIMLDPCWFVPSLSCCLWVVHSFSCKFICAMYCCRRSSIQLMSIIHVVLSGLPMWDVVCMYRQSLIELTYRYLLQSHRIHRRTWRFEGRWLGNNNNITAFNNYHTHTLHHHWIFQGQNQSYVMTSSPSASLSW